MSFFKFLDKALATLIRGRKFGHEIKFKGVYNVECRDQTGRLKWREAIPNGVTTAGLTDILEQYLRTGTNRHPFYIGLIDLTGYSALAAGDTISSHAGWLEATPYSNSTRVAWGPAAAAAQAISNSVAAVFNINATATIKGVFIVNESTKGGTTGNLWATALFSGDQAVVNGDTISVTYTVNGA